MENTRWASWLPHLPCSWRLITGMSGAGAQRGHTSANAQNSQDVLGCLASSVGGAINHWRARSLGGNDRRGSIHQQGVTRVPNCVDPGPCTTLLFDHETPSRRLLTIPLVTSCCWFRAGSRSCGAQLGIFWWTPGYRPNVTKVYRMESNEDGPSESKLNQII